MKIRFLQLLIVLTACVPFAGCGLGLTLGWLAGQKEDPVPGNLAPYVTIMEVTGKQSGVVDVPFMAYDHENDSVSLAFDYWRSGTWNACTQDNEAGDDFSEVTTQKGSNTYRFAWDTSSDVPATDEEIVLRITPTEVKTGNAGSPDCISITVSNNSPPVVDIVEERLNSSVLSSDVLIEYTLLDTGGHNATVTIEYAVAGIFRTCSEVSSNSWSEGLTGLSTGTVSPDTHFFVWDTLEDVGEAYEDEVQIRITARDTATGTAKFSEYFTVNNNSPPAGAFEELAATYRGVATIQFTLYDNASDPVTAALYYTTDDWATQPPNKPGALKEFGRPLENLESSPEGTSHYFYWDTTRDFPGIDADNVQLMLVVSDPYETGDNSFSTRFKISNLTVINSPPQATITSPTGEQTGDVTFVYYLFDSDNDSVSIYPSYSTDGQTWLPATQGLGGDGTSGLGAKPNGSVHTFVWDSSADLPGQYVETAQFALRPYDSENGTMVKTNQFTVNNNSLPYAAISTSHTTETGDVSLGFTLTDPDAETCSVSIQYSINSGVSFNNATQSGSLNLAGLFASASGSSYTFVWNSNADLGEDVLNTVVLKVLPTDGSGKSGTGDQTDVFAVDNNTPPVANLTGVIGNSGDIDLEYTLTDSKSHIASITVFFKRGVDSSWNEATETVSEYSDGTSGLSTSPAGVSHRFVWNSYADIGPFDCDSVLLAISPSDTDAGILSSQVSVNVRNKSLANQPPKVLVYTPTGEQSGDVPVVYRLQDKESDFASIQVRYSVAGGPFYTATEAGETLSEGKTGLATSSTGVNHIFVWDSVRDVGNTNTSSAIIRIIPSDSNQGASDSTEAFPLYNNAAPRAQVVSVPPQAADNVSVSYLLYDSNNDALDVTIEYSPNGGLTWYSATQAGGDGIYGLSSSSGGMPHSFIWDSVSDAGRASLSSVRIRITPYDSSGAGTPGTSENFEVNNNDAPVVFLSTPSSTVSGSSVQIQYTLMDSNSDEASLSVYYSTNNGASYSPCTLLETLSGLATSPSGINGSFTWDTLSDVGVSDSRFTLLRATPSDTETGSPTVTDYFRVNNNEIPSASSVLVTGNSGTVEVEFVLTDSSSHNCSVLIEYSIDGSPDYHEATGTPTTGLQSSPTGVQNAFYWDTAADLPSDSAMLTVRVTPSDSENGVSSESSSVRIDNDDPPVVTAYTPIGNSTDLIFLDYKVADNGSDLVSVLAEYSIDNGNSWHTATAASHADHENTAEVDTLPGGVLHLFVWDSLADTGQNNCEAVFRFTATDLGSTYKTASDETEAFQVLNAGAGGNVSPSATITQPTSPKSGYVTLLYNLYDPNTNDTANISVTYSLSGGPFNDATEYPYSPSEGTGPLSTSPGGDSHVFVWDSRADLGDADHTDVRIRIIPTDAAGETGCSSTTSTFAVNNNKAPVVVVGAPSSPASGNVSISYVLYDSASDQADVWVRYSYDGGSTFYNATSAGGDGVTGLAASPSGVGHTFIWDTEGANYASVVIRITPSDYSMTGAHGQSASFQVSNVTATKLVVVLPGQTLQPGSVVTGSPEIERAGTPFEVEVFAVSEGMFVDYSSNESISLSTGDANAPTPTGPANLSNGSAVFSVTMNTANASAILNVEGVTLTNANSSAFEVEPGPASRIIVVLPGQNLVQGGGEKSGEPDRAVVGGTAFPVVVNITDDFFNVIADSAANAAITSSDSRAYIGDLNGSLPGNLTVSNGTAIFGNSGEFVFKTAGFHTVTVSDPDGALAGDTSALVEVTDTLTWNGMNGTAWSDSGNWDPPVVPSALASVYIPDTANDPVLDNDAQVASLETVNASVLTLNGYDLFVAGDVTIGCSSELDGSDSVVTLGGAWACEGTYTTSANSSVIFSGPTGQSLPTNTIFMHVNVANTGNDTTLSGTIILQGDLLVSENATLDIQSGATVDGDITVDGTLDLTGVTLSVTGDASLNGSCLFDGSSLLRLEGSSVQTISGGPWPGTMVATGSNAILGSDVSTDGTLSISGGSLDLAGYDLSLTGDFIDDGTFTANSGRLVLNGSSSAEIKGSPVSETLGTVVVYGSTALPMRALTLDNLFIATGTFDCGPFTHAANTLQVTGGTFKSDSPADVVEANSVYVQGGSFDVSAGTIRFTTSFSTSSGAFNPTAGMVEYTGVLGTLSTDCASSFADLLINGGLLSLSSDLHVNGTLTIPAGVVLSTGTRGVDVDTTLDLAGTVSAGAGSWDVGEALVSSTGSMNLSSTVLRIGSLMEIQGSFKSTSATVTAIDGAARFSFQVLSGAELDISGLDFSYADTSGFDIRALPTFTSFSNVAFKNVASGGRHLSLSFDNDFNASWDAFSFDNSFDGGANVYAEGNGYSAVVLFTGHSGDGTGEAYDSESGGAYVLFSGPPEASVQTPPGEQSGRVTLNYTLSDPDNDTCAVSVEYTTDNATYLPCTEYSLTVSEGTSGLEADFTGSAHVFVWNSRTDLAGLSGQVVKIRITPADLENGASGETAAFVVDNNTPPYACLHGDGVIRRIDASGSPPPRKGAAAFSLPGTDAFYLYGGMGCGSVVLDDLWRFENDSWVQPAPSGTSPGGRCFHSVVYDYPHRRAIVFGGDNSGSMTNEVYSLDLSGDGNGSWTKLSPTGTPPVERAMHTAIYDVTNQRMIVFGGLYNGGHLDDVIALDLSDGGDGSWSDLSPTGTPPSGRYSHSAAYDPYRQRMLVFGGTSGTLSNAVYELSLEQGVETWSEVSPSGQGPTARMGADAIYDPVDRIFAVFGGLGENTSYFGELWGVNFSDNSSGEWMEFTGGYGPVENAAYSSVAYNLGKHQALVFGGEYDGTVSDLTQMLHLSYAGRGGITELSPGGSAPPAGAGAEMFYDEPNRCLLVVGNTGEVYEHSRDSSHDGAWAQMFPSGTAPSLEEFRMVYDSAHMRAVTFDSLGNVGVLSRTGGSGAWTVYGYTSGAPVGRTGFETVYDGFNQRMLLFGGNESGTLKNDLWAYSLDDSGEGAWTQLSPTGGSPEARMGHAMVFDPERGLVVIFGGENETHALADLWTLDVKGFTNGEWKELNATAPPTGRSDAACAVINPGSRFVVSGGRDFAGTSLGGFYLVDPSASSPEWETLNPGGLNVPALYGHSAVYQEEENDLVLFGGTTGTRDLDTLLVSQFGGFRDRRGGDVKIYYNLYDRESDNAGVIVEYSPNGGYDWYPATEGAGSDGTTNLSASVTGSAHLFVWDSAADLDNEDLAEIMVCVTPCDASENGGATCTPGFRLDNVAPRVDAVTQNLDADATGRVIDVEFSEEVSRIIAEDISLYSSSGGQTIASVELLSCGSVVRITFVDAPHPGEDTISISGFNDEAGNDGGAVGGLDIDGVDIFAPEVTILEPSSGGIATGNATVSYTLSEDCLNGSITWTRTGGELDSSSPHTVTLTGANLLSGVHDDVPSAGSPSLQPGAEYTVTLKFFDLPGNGPGEASVTGVEYHDEVSLQYKIASTEGLKILIEETGLYKVTYTDFDCAGLSTAFEPNNLRCFNNGSEIAVYIYGAEDNTFDPGDYVIIYGVAYEDEYTDKNAYYLVADDSPGARMTTFDATPVSSPSGETEFQRTLHYETDQYFLPLENGGYVDRWMWSYAISNTGGGAKNTSYTIDVNALASPGKNASFSWYLQGYSDDRHDYRLFLQGVELGGGTFYAENQSIVTGAVIGQSDMVNGSNTVTLEVAGVDTNIVYRNWFELIWWSLYEAENNALAFSCSVAGDHDVHGFTETDIILVDVTDPSNAVWCSGQETLGGTTTFYHAGTKSYVAASLANLETPTCYKNNASNLYSTSNDADYLLITHSDFMCASEDLASWRSSYNGYDVVIADVEDVYDEFNFGRKSPDAIRNFLSRIYTSWQQPAPAFVCLVGDASWDTKAVGGSEVDFVPTKYFAADYSYSASDPMLADVTGNDCKSEFYIGRIPAVTLYNASVVVDKIIEYENGTYNGTWEKEVLLSCGYQDQGSNSTQFREESESLRGYIPVDYTTDLAYQTDCGSAYNTYLAFKGSVNEGVLVANYIGHGLMTKIGTPDFWKTDYVPGLTNNGKYCFFVGCTCLSGTFQSNVSPSLGEVMAMAPDKGAIAFWGSSGNNLLDPQMVMNRELFYQIFTENQRVLGRAIEKAKDALRAYGLDTTVRDSVMSYNLLGDPALELKKE